MTFRKLPFNFHDAEFTGFRLGPRRELTLQVRLDPVWNDGQAKETSIRFGSIQNWERVQDFFSRIPATAPDTRVLGRIDGVTYHATQKNILFVDLDPQGRLELDCRSVTVP